MRRSILISATLAVFVSGWVPMATADTPTLTSYQGILLDGIGDPVTTPVSVDFNIWDAETVGNSVWNETQTVTPDDEGRFSVLLGQNNPLTDDVFSEPDRWLGIAVEAGPELSPRTRIVSGAYAQRVATVDGATGGSIAGDVQILGASDNTVVNLRELSSGSGFVSTIGPNGSVNVSLTHPSGSPNNGTVAVRDEFDNSKAFMYASGVGSGMVYTRGPNGNGNVSLASLSGYPDNGYVAVRDGQDIRARMYVTSLGTGWAGTQGPNGSFNVRLSTLTGYPNNGYVAVRDEFDNTQAGVYVNSVGAAMAYFLGPGGGLNGGIGNLLGYPDNGIVLVDDAVNPGGLNRAGMYAHPDEAGMVWTAGANRTGENTVLTFLAGYPDNGYVAAIDPAGNWKAGMYIDANGDGVIYADVKNFRMANPADQTTEIWYASLEGPEAAAYIRGTGRLINGRTEITFEEHFANIASSQGMTVQLTPLSAESKGLAVIDKSSDGMVVAELNSGKGTYDFDFMVMAVRKGYEDYRVIRSASEARPAMNEHQPALIDGVEEEAEPAEAEAPASTEAESIDINSRPR